jgi:hypothetical protein
VLGIDGPDLYARRRQQAFDVMHRRNQQLALRQTQRGKQ